MIDARDNWLQYYLRFSGVRNPCHRCHGLGHIAYSSTATWRGGMGGAAMTRDVCNSCWGSGIEGEPWTDIQKLEAEMDAQVEARAVSWLADITMARWPVMRPAILELIAVFEKLERERRPRPPYFQSVTRALAAKLREILRGTATTPDSESAGDS